MASTTALFTGLSGLSANSRSLEVIGNNIANVNTTAFKSARLLFASQFARTFSVGSTPTENFGGSNPTQVGLGVGIAGTSRNFSNGAITATGDPRNLAIEGSGFFVVERNGEQFYTRAGAFRQNANSDLISITGERLQGYAVDEEFNVIEGNLVDLNVPIGSLTIAEATRNVQFTGNLNATGDLPTQGTQITFPALTEISTGNPASATTLLTDLDFGTAPSFAAGDQIQINGAEKGTRRLPTVDYTVTATSTVADYMDFLDQALGIADVGAANTDGNTAGVSIDAAGVITINGNMGSKNHIGLEPADIRHLDSAGGFVQQPVAPVTQQNADGESVRTTFVVFDSLGTPLDVEITLVLDNQDSTGTTWRYFVESDDDTDVDLEAGTGTVSFDAFGKISSIPQFNITIDRDGTGAADPLIVTLSLDSPGNSITALTDNESNMAAIFQDGAPLGVLSNFSVGPDGQITGAFTNGLTRTIGQVALAVFASPEGLVDVGGNLFSTGPNSGTPVITGASELGSGRIIGSALEVSNVDLSEEFINLILSSTGYSASSRVITTADQLIQQLLRS